MNESVNNDASNKTSTKWNMPARPARKQKDLTDQVETHKVHEGTYNIWYNKWTGQKHKGRFEYGERAPTRVNVSRDTGFTLADKRKQQNKHHRTYICLMFARGCCRKGHKCEFLHRIPSEDDPEETMKDCFGRDRHRDEKDDMNGVGSFNRENVTLYVGNLHPYDRPDGEKVIQKHFGVYGPIERINVIYDKSIAFVRYVRRNSAEFAKEAMEHQLLDGGDIVSIRWANDDPNPKAIAEAKRKIETEFADGYVAKKTKHDEIQYLDEEAKRLVEENPMYSKYYQYGEAEDEDDVPQTRQDDTASNELLQAYYAQYQAQYYAELAKMSTNSIANNEQQDPPSKINLALKSYNSDEED